MHTSYLLNVKYYRVLLHGIVSLTHLYLQLSHVQIAYAICLCCHTFCPIYIIHSVCFCLYNRFLLHTSSWCPPIKRRWRAVAMVLTLSQSFPMFLSLCLMEFIWVSNSGFLPRKKKLSRRPLAKLSIICIMMGRIARMLMLSSQLWWSTFHIANQTSLYQGIIVDMHGWLHMDMFVQEWTCVEQVITLCMRNFYWFSDLSDFSLSFSGDSEGLYFDEYTPQEQKDACEIINWLCQQFWCNAKVVTIWLRIFPKISLNDSDVSINVFIGWYVWQELGWFQRPSGCLWAAPWVGSSHFLVQHGWPLSDGYTLGWRVCPGWRHAFLGLQNVCLELRPSLSYLCAKLEEGMTWSVW